MSKKKEFEEDLKRIIDIYFSAQETFLINKELYNENNLTQSESYLRNMNTFFHFCKIYFWRNTVLELSKLFNENANEKFNIIKFISKLKPNGHFKTLKFDEEFLNRLSNQISEKQHLIENLVEQRDKVYAHEDRNNQNVKNIISHKEAEQLLKIVKYLIKEIYYKHYKTSIQFDLINSPATSLKYLLESLSKLYNIEEQERIELIKSMGKSST